MKIARKVLIYATIAIASFLIIVSVSVWLFKDQIIRQFIAEMNKSLNTPVTIGSVDISMWSDFPDMSIVFTDVYVEDSHPGNYPLLTAKRISFSLNPFDAWNGDYRVKGLHVSASETNLKLNEQGENNYTIVKDTPGGQTKTVVFDLKDISLNDTKVRYHDVRNHADHIFSSNDLIASISLRGPVYDIEAAGDITTHQIGTGTSVLLKEKTFDVSTRLIYDDARRSLIINPSLIKINKASFDVAGTYTFKQDETIDITATAKEADIHTVLSLLPEDLTKKLAKWESDGDVYFTITMKGEMSARKTPSLSVAFGCRDASFHYSGFSSKITHASMEGSFASPSMAEFSNAALFLKGVSGQLDGKDFSGSFSMDNFENPLISLKFKGDVDAGSIFRLYPIDEIKHLSGVISADVSFNGRIALLKKKSTAQQVRAMGSIDMKNLAVTYGKENLQFEDVGGSLQFNNNDLALSDVNGKFGKSDFRINGFLKNVITWALFENQPLGIEADLRSDFIDLDQLFAIGQRDKGNGDFKFQISPALHLNFNCDIRALRYRRFRATDVKGDLLLKNQKAISRNINLNAMGGNLSLNGIVDTRNAKAIDISSTLRLKGIHLDSVFYIFENFDQNFIEDKHLKGQTFADVSVEMTLNEKLKLYPETLIADIGVVIKNGELNNFEPMQKLNKYLDDQGLASLRFADLKNDIHIEKKTIYIPQMEVRSNVTTIQVSGTHTFDQRIDYRVVAPLNSRKKIDRDEAFGAIEEDNSGKSRLFLKITGTTEKYVISYDRDAVKKKIKNDLRKEVQELKDAFRNKGIKKKKEVEVEKDEYFDWDNR